MTTTTLTPGQLLLLAAFGGAAGVTILAALLAFGYAAGVLALKAFDRLCEKRMQWQDRRAAAAARREFDRITALYHQPAHPEEDR